jgi:hypothetical protein
MDAGLLDGSDGRLQIQNAMEMRLGKADKLI